jgi:hypothetical protein
MGTRLRMVIASGAVAMTFAATVVASTSAETAYPARERPRGVVVDCSRVSGIGRGLREFTHSKSLLVGPLAVPWAKPTLAYAPAVGGNKIFVLVRGGHRVTLELSRQTRRGAGLGVGFGEGQGDVELRDTRRVVTFRACERSDSRHEHATDWPVTGWVGFLLADSARCVPLLVWVDDEPAPRRTVIRFGVRSCE